MSGKCLLSPLLFFFDMSNWKYISLIILSILILTLAGCQIIDVNRETPAAMPKEADKGTMVQTGYKPVINPDDFSSTVDNKYFSLVPGKTFVYEGKTEEGTERIEMYISHDKKMVMGVETIVVWDRVWLNDDLIEDTYDWYAQDKDGNVWYFGEDTKEMEAGKIVSTKGSWEAGVDGAQPGIAMKGTPKIGAVYKQEYYKGKAEDMGTVLEIGELVSIKYGSFSDCLKTQDWTPLEKGINEHKYYCPKVGGMVLEVGVESGERIELVEIKVE